MRLTSNEVRHALSAPSGSGRGVALVALALLAIGVLDYETASAPVQHLYYLPIIWAAIRFGRRGGMTAATSAVVLYHLANPHLLRLGHETGDVLQVVLFVTVGLVTTRLAEDAERMRLLAHTDDLTGLHNLRSFEARLADLLERARRRRSSVALIVLDLDRLKALNEAYGHLAGAEAVRTVGEVIARQIAPQAVACRYGGDEFVIALPDCGSVQAALVAESLRLAVLEQEPTLAGHRLPVGSLSISLGVASREMADSATPFLGEELFREADGALYVAKEGGRNRVHSTGAAVASLPRGVRTPQAATGRGA